MSSHTPNAGSRAMRSMYHPQSAAAPSARGPATSFFSARSSFDPTITCDDHTSAAQYSNMAAPSGVGFMSSTPTSPRQLAAAAWPASADTEQSKSSRPPTSGLFGGGWSNRADQDMVNPSGTDVKTTGSVGSATSTTISASTVNTTSIPLTNEGKMHELISLQTFDGSWKWTAKLLVMLGVDGEKVKAVLAGVDETVVATVLAVGFLEGKMPEEEGVWEMVVEKAKGWLESKTSESKYVDTLIKVKEDVFGVV